MNQLCNHLQQNLPSLPKRFSFRIFTSAGYVGTFLGGLLGGAFYQSASMES